MLGIAADLLGHVYVTAASSYSIKMLSNSGISDICSDVCCELSLMEGTATTFAGGGQSGSIDGVGTNAKFTSPGVMTVDTMSVVYIADYLSIRKMTSTGNDAAIFKQELTCVLLLCRNGVTGCQCSFHDKWNHN